MRIFLFLLFTAFLSGCIYSNNSSDSLGVISRNSQINQPFSQPEQLTEKSSEAPPNLGQADFDINSFQLADKLEVNANRFPNSRFQGDFFKGDETGEKILAGQITNYSIADFQGATENNRKTFAFKVLNALRMLGYKLGCDYGYYTCWHNFLKENNLAQSDTISKEALEKLDAQLAELEKTDSTAARGFPLYNNFVEENLSGEPSKNHLVALFAKMYGLLPPQLVGNAAAFRNYFAKQLPEGGGEDYAIKCNSQDKCIVSFRNSYYSSLTNENDSNNIFVIRDDFVFPATNLHEYAHYLDGSVYEKNEGLKQGIINTSSFYAITYNLSTEFRHEIGWKYYRPNKNFTGREGEFFVSAYAKGWQQDEKLGFYTAYEDFAESFGMYVLAGNVFRCKAQQHPVLMQKYNWLKQNVFNGVEYNYEKAGQCNETYSNYYHYITNSPFSKLNINEVRRVS